MKLYCANCGMKLNRIRKAVPKHGIILDLIEVHTCLESPVDPLSVIFEAPIASSDRNKFVESLNGLKPAKPEIGRNYSEKRSLRPSSMTGTDDLRDRRFDNEKEQVSSTAPLSVLEQIKKMGNSIPANELKDDTTESEMGD